MAILVTGGAGYIGSHTCVRLLEAGYEIIILDNLSNSKPEVLNRIRGITGKSFEFIRGDMLDRNLLEDIFCRYSIDAVIHFAGFKAVGESVGIPLSYYHNNVSGSIVLFETMLKYGVKNLVFSSSATVYGTADKMPLSEDTPLGVVNPYGRTKLMIEDILRDIYVSDNSWNIILLRYFNPVGAHGSGLIGEDPNGIPNNLVPYISQVAVGKLKELGVFGNDYPTRDGTCIRDYIHVLDLADGHLKALEKLEEKPGIEKYNLGTGRGTSVLEMVDAYSKAIGRQIPYSIKGRRPGDMPECYADPSKAERELGWKATRNIVDMCRDAWKWQEKNPLGYED
ncbi:MAG TPA: UDP-glucose 4-epimerase GalE [Clostridia bacterium]|nr:UDP-glucose 4-epimerase GalE [Clostridia bacterium]